MKNKFLLPLIFVGILLITGCNKDKKLTCARNVTLSDGKTSLSENYDIYYDSDNNVVKTVSTGRLTTTDKSLLETHKNSNEQSCALYSNIDYYDCDVSTSGDTLTIKKTIDYDKVDYKKIIEIEGSSGNIFDDKGKVKLSTLKKVYEKAGSECDK